MELLGNVEIVEGEHLVEVFDLEIVGLAFVAGLVWMVGLEIVEVDPAVEIVEVGLQEEAFEIVDHLAFEVVLGIVDLPALEVVLVVETVEVGLQEEAFEIVDRLAFEVGLGIVDHLAFEVGPAWVVSLPLPWSRTRIKRS